MEYTIIGFYPERGLWALVSPAGADKNEALKILRRMVLEPTENDKKLIGNATVLSINTIRKEEAWWNDPFMLD